MTSRKPRIVTIVAAALIGAVLIAFGAAMFGARAERKESADRRFAAEAQISAAVIESVFSSSAGQSAQEFADRFGGRRIPQAALDQVTRRSNAAYAAVLDDRGRILGASTGTAADVRAALTRRPVHVRRALAGEPWRLSGILEGDVVEQALAFDGPSGRRVVVQAYPLDLLASFLGGTLARLPNAEREQAYIVDGGGLALASDDEGFAPGSRAPSMDGNLVATQAVVGGSDWSVVLSARSADIYQGVSSTLPWLVLAALTIAGSLALFLLTRAMRQADELKDAYAQLEATNADLGRTNTELARSNGELEQFASVASHDLQEPLRKVQTFGDQLERRHAHALDDEAKDYLRRMRNASARMSVLIDDLLRFSRVTTHAKPHVPVDLGRIAADVLQDLEARVGETGGRVDVGPLPKVEADPTQMRQLLQNLIANALKFHRPGVPPVVEVREARSPRPGMVAITVSDNGIGFEDTYQERIFRVFERLHPRDVYAGTGIGLALCRKIAERHGGSIAGAGRPDEGSTFTVVLPVAQAAAPPDGASCRPEPAHA